MNVGKDDEYIADGNVKMVYWFWKMAISQKAKHTHTLGLKSSTLSIYPSEMRTYVHKKTYTQTFIGVLFPIAKCLLKKEKEYIIEGKTQFTTSLTESI